MTGKEHGNGWLWPLQARPYITLHQVFPGVPPTPSVAVVPVVVPPPALAVVPSPAPAAVLPPPAPVVAPPPPIAPVPSHPIRAELLKLDPMKDPKAFLESNIFSGCLTFVLVI